MEDAVACRSPSWTVEATEKSSVGFEGFVEAFYVCGKYRIYGRSVLGASDEASKVGRLHTAHSSHYADTIAPA